MLRWLRWATLLLACAAGGVFGGALGALGAGALCLLLAKIPAVRQMPNAAQWVLLPMALVGLVVVQAAGRNVMKQGAAESVAIDAQAATPQRTPMQQRAVEAVAAKDAVDAANDDWSRTALAFEQAHPDLKLGSNTAVMQDMLERLARPDSAADALLAQAYAAARSDPRWVGGYGVPTGRITWDDEPAPQPVR